jgi:hypothetical protein
MANGRVTRGWDHKGSIGAYDSGLEADHSVGLKHLSYFILELFYPQLRIEI